MKTAALILLLLLAGGMVYVRLAPSDPARWHVDPVAADDPGTAGIRIAPGQVTSALGAGALLAEFDAAVRAEPRVRVLAGSVAEGQITYVLRSRVIGFPDYLTVWALPDGTGSTLALLSRLRFGASDLGVNAARVARLLDRMGDGVLLTR